MKAMIAYFDTHNKATLAAEVLRGKGVREEILIMRPRDEGIFNEIENQSMRREKNHPFNTGIYGITSGLGGSISFASTMMPRSESMHTSEVTKGLTEGLSKNTRKAIKNIMEAGNTVVFIKSEKTDKKFITDILRESGGKLI